MMIYYYHLASVNRLSDSYGSNLSRSPFFSFSHQKQWNIRGYTAVASRKKKTRRRKRGKKDPKDRHCFDLAPKENVFWVLPSFNTPLTLFIVWLCVCVKSCSLLHPLLQPVVEMVVDEERWAGNQRRRRREEPNGRWMVQTRRWEGETFSSKGKNIFRYWEMRNKKKKKKISQLTIRQQHLRINELRAHTQVSWNWLENDCVNWKGEREERSVQH